MAHGIREARSQIEDAAEVWMKATSPRLMEIALEHLHVDLITHEQQIIDDVLWVTLKTTITGSGGATFDVSSMKTLPIKDIGILPDILIGGQNIYKDGVAEVLAIREEQRQQGAEAILVVVACPVYSLIFLAAYAVVPNVLDSTV